MHTRDISIGDRTISIETGRLAKQADGSVLVRSGDTMVLVSACAAVNPREGIDFLPLTVDYREYTYASGRIPGGFFKREGKPTEKEVLTSRLIDRPIRPLFPNGWRKETQIIALLMSADGQNDSDVLAITGAAAALALSGIPFTRTLAGVRIGLIDGRFIVNPTFEERRNSRLDLTVAGTSEGIVMVEAGAKEVSEEEMVEALDTAHKAIKEIVAGIDALAKQAGKKKNTIETKTIDAAFKQSVHAKAYDKLASAMRIHDKLENYATVDGVLHELVESYDAADEEGRADAKSVFKDMKEQVMRDEALERGKRLDGRRFDEIRPISIEVGVMPRTHGSALFTRGETQ
ncbi:MAG: polyribonucleotide nucleotidyltransferase, partial [Vicinamibacterales bacterium]